MRASRFCVSAFLLFRTAYRVLSRVLHTVTARLRSIAVFDGSLKRSPCMMHCIVLHHRVPPGTYLTYLKVPLRYLSTLGLSYYDNLIHIPLQLQALSSKTSASWKRQTQNDLITQVPYVRVVDINTYLEFQYGLKVHTLPRVSWSYPLRQYLSFLLFFYSINIDIHLLIVETYMSRNQRRLGRRIFIPPYNVLVLFSVDVGRIIAWFAFIWTVSYGITISEILPLDLEFCIH